MRFTALFVFIIGINPGGMAQTGKTTDIGLHLGVLSPGKLNSITDVAGVAVGQVTLVEGDSVRTGVTAILPIRETCFQQTTGRHLCPQRFWQTGGQHPGKTNWATSNHPSSSLNTLSVARAIDAVITYTLRPARQ